VLIFELEKWYNFRTLSQGEKSHDR